MSIPTSFVVAYVAGGITMVPLLLCIVVIGSYFSKPIVAVYHALRAKRSQDPCTSPLPANDVMPDLDWTSGQFYKVGWLRVSRDPQDSLPDASIGEMVKSYISRKSTARNGQFYFAVLKYSTLFLYDSEKQLDCKGVIIVNNHTVKMHPPGLQDFELFSRPHLIKLEKKLSSVLLPHFDDAQPLMDESAYYINCNRCIDKEDWYFAFRRASQLQLAAHGEPPLSTLKHMQDTLPFDQVAMNQLINTVYSDEHHLQTQWFNTILGRMFFAVYKTDQVKSTFYKKVIAKIDKINAKRPPFLGEITVRSVDPGHSVPYLTQPRLLGLSPTGELTVEANMQYDGGFRLEIETVLKWKYSDRLRPLTIDLVLGIALKSIQGKFLMKIKEPPTNRLWYGFYELPKMEWIVDPVVWEKRVGYSVVVKAIETKIQELIMETMVLPNMDDITFFPTDGVGGIFSKSADEDPLPKREPESQSQEEDDSSVTGGHKKEARSSSMPTARSAPSLFAATTSTTTTTTPAAPATKSHPTKVRKRSWFTKGSTTTNPSSSHRTSEELPSTSQDQRRKQQQQKQQSSPSTAHPKLSVSDTTVSSHHHSSGMEEYPNQRALMNLLNRKNHGNHTTTAAALYQPSSHLAIPKVDHDMSHYHPHSSSMACILSTSPDSLSSSPSSNATDDSSISHHHSVGDEGSILITPSLSVTSESIQTAYSQGTPNSSSLTLVNEELHDALLAMDSHQPHDARLRKSSSLARLRSKSLASTAVSQVNVCPAMVHTLGTPSHHQPITEKKDTETLNETASAFIHL
ncbi:putative integral membrane protein conserved region-domain-containing protein [Radiomyces spectabilis]|uniref:putative integral membrane protein conserved region-domain-containing protein n=1 Tax=Radiomyces spectabilis TaxID=64574 RepID=UPI00221F951E|nr:putative integral membrane protein conserved region-domain-containing protein [Radiomyces spectabilis]KAI8372741.1 putative integral membrane protein conserved region-domain-containing protein [Radiomyces spectabilis]